MREGEVGGENSHRGRMLPLIKQGASLSQRALVPSGLEGSSRVPLMHKHF